MRLFTIPLALTLTLAAALPAWGGGHHSNSASTLAVIGDLPYGTSATDTTEFTASPAFISAINADPDASLVLHLGDIHSGKQYCTEAYNQSIYAQWTAFKRPLIYTPGDNEWADCHKVKEGGGSYSAATGTIRYQLDGSGQLMDYAGGDPVANLSLVRSIFFAKPGKALGGGTMTVHTQAQEFDTAHPSDSSYPENVWFEKSGALFVALNIPGGSNNDTDPWYDAPAMSPAQAQEVAHRSAANLRWLDTAFTRAQRHRDLAVVILFQADMWNLDDNTASHLTQYQQFIDRIASHTTAFGKPVLMLNGDSHLYRSDNPLVQGAACVMEPRSGAAATACSSDAYANQPHGYNVPNFHRIVVHGSTAPLEWLKLRIDPSANASHSTNAFGPFSWQRVQPPLN